MSLPKTISGWCMWLYFLWVGLGAFIALPMAPTIGGLLALGYAILRTAWQIKYSKMTEPPNWEALLFNFGKHLCAVQRIFPIQTALKIPPCG